MMLFDKKEQMIRNSLTLFDDGLGGVGGGASFFEFTLEIEDVSGCFLGGKGGFLSVVSIVLKGLAGKSGANFPGLGAIVGFSGVIGFIEFCDGKGAESLDPLAFRSNIDFILTTEIDGIVTSFSCSTKFDPTDLVDVSVFAG
jgi:hypothetical protein